MPVFILVCTGAAFFLFLINLSLVIIFTESNELLQEALTLLIKQKKNSLDLSKTLVSG